MKGWGSKVVHVLKTEGAWSLMNRTRRYARYRVKRALMDPSDTIREWGELRGRYAGRRAFLLGNGPSLNQTELYLLENEFTMCFNRFDLMLERVNWLPTFYTTIDDRVLLDTADIANEIARVADYAFFPDIHPYNVDFRPFIEKRDNVYWLFLDLPRFSDNLPYCGINKTVANVGLQILAYLGFTEIYLLGMDMSYKVPETAKITGARDIEATEDDDENHFDPRYFGKGRKYHVPMLDEAFAKFREARRFLGERGVQVLNATVGGELEEFERVALSDVLEVSAEERRRRFLENLRGRLRSPGADVEGLIEGAPLHDAPDGSATGVRAFRTEADRVQDFLRPYIYDFVPFGPYEGFYFFVSRSLLMDDVLTPQEGRMRQRKEAGHGQYGGT